MIWVWLFLAAGFRLLDHTFRVLLGACCAEFFERYSVACDIEYLSA